jgi:hypothetical protein
MKKAIVAAAIIVIVIVAVFAGVLITQSLAPAGPPKAYVGVAYCGNTVADGKAMIDKVKGYTNLFVLNSGLLQRDLKSVEELGDYAIANGLDFLPYFGQVTSTRVAWLEQAKQRWGDHLVGIYYADEPGGKMIDGYVEFRYNNTGDTITKTTYGDLVFQKQNGIVINYQVAGTILLDQPTAQGSDSYMSEAKFYPNGTIQVIKPAPNGFTYKSYQELQNIKPFKTIEDTAQQFLARDKANIDALKVNGTKVFTSDYTLYWFDNLAGYDVVLGQVGWNLTLNQQIGLMRGAATVQNKEWGIVITWKYQQPPYLANGTEILNQLRTAYECGAKYLVFFDYYFEEDNNPYGTMTEEHFQALQTFWTDVIQNPKDTWNSVKADSVLVLPQNYGWGTRAPWDKIWGIFVADEKTQQIWDFMQNKLQEHDYNIDIVVKDSRYPLPEQYQNVYTTDDLG